MRPRDPRSEYALKDFDYVMELGAQTGTSTAVAALARRTTRRPSPTGWAEGTSRR
ncbi:hypothetical protein [Ramlibacter sp.]|uniref:hypothetical protein n=1 Tax=Ramlibacter sp. TaxID=1917967 RepID=UPI00261A9880|nr:hypothetical protein [Ramlibacter sp.]